MITRDQFEGNGIELFQEVTKFHPLPVELTVKKVSEKKDPFGLKIPDHTDQFIQVSIRNCQGNGDPGSAKMPGFSQMQVCDQEGLFLLPVDTAQRVQLEVLPG